MNKPFNVDEMRRIIEQLREPAADPKTKSEPAKRPRALEGTEASRRLQDG